MRTEEINRGMEDVSRYLEKHGPTEGLSVRDVAFASYGPTEGLSVRDVAFASYTAKSAIQTLVRLGYVQETGAVQGHPDNQLKSVVPYRAYMGDNPARTRDDLRPEPSACFNPQDLPQGLTRSELSWLMDWASGQVAMLDQARPQEPELGDGPAVITFVRQMDGELWNYAALRAEDGWWAVTNLTVRMTWSQLLDWIESGSSPNHDAIATIRSVDVRA